MYAAAVVLSLYAVVRFSTKINMQFTSGTSADQFSAGLSGSYNGWGVSVTAAASYAKDKANQTGRVTFQASRDVLPIGYQVCERHAHLLSVRTLQFAGSPGCNAAKFACR